MKHRIKSKHNGILCAYYTPNRIIATSKICFYFISYRKSIPKDAKLYVNVNVLHLKLKFTKLKVLISSLQSL